jgi:hypothetical protein
MPSARLDPGEVGDQIQSFVANPAAASTATIGAAAAPGVGFRWAVYGWSINANGGANTVVLGSAANPKTPVMGFAANAGTNMPPNDVIPLFECNENEALTSTLTAATAVGIQVWAAKARV